MSRKCILCERTFTDRGYGVHRTRIHGPVVNSNSNDVAHKRYDPLQLPSPEVSLIFAGKMIASLRADKSISTDNMRVKLYFDLLDDALERIKDKYI